MSDTRVLLNRIAAIRHRLGQAQTMLFQAQTEALELAENAPLADQVERTRRVQTLLDTSLRQLNQTARAETLPPVLTNRARRCLERAHELVGQLRLMDADPLIASGGNVPLSRAYARAASMIESAVRLAQSFPAAAGDQIRLCDGLDGLFDAAAEQAGRVTLALRRETAAQDRLQALAHLLDSVVAGREQASEGFFALAEGIEADVRQGEHPYWHEAGPISTAADENSARAWRLRLVAGHSLNVAQVVAQVVPHYASFANQPIAAIVGALLHNVGMLAVPSDVLALPTPFGCEQTRVIESHSEVGATLIEKYVPRCAWMASAVRQHHERPSGTGYPTGCRNIAPLARLIAVCDIYCALQSDRPHRRGIDPRQALTELLLQADQGLADHEAVSAIRRLSFFPPGTVVELNDRSLGVVAAVHGESANQWQACPVVAVLTDPGGAWLPATHWVDLALSPGLAIVRVLPAHERRRRLGEQYPHYV